MITSGSIVSDVSSLEKWWSNTIMTLPDSSSAVQTLSTDSIIYIANSTISTKGYEVTAKKVSIVFTDTGKLVNNDSSGTSNSAMICFATGADYILIEGPYRYNKGSTISDYVFDSSAYTAQRHLYTNNAKYFSINGISANSGNGLAHHKVDRPDYNNRMSYQNIYLSAMTGIIGISFWEQNVKNIFVKNMNLFNVGFGFDIGNSGLTVDFPVQNSHFENIYGKTLGSNAVWIGSRNDAIRPSNLYMKNIEVDGFGLWGGVFVNRFDGAHLENLNFKNGSGKGIRVINSDTVKMVNIHIENTDHKGVQVSGSNYIIENMKVINSRTNNCIDINVDTVSINGAYASNCEDYGIHIWGSGTSLTNAVAHNARLNGIMVFDTPISINNAISYNNGAAGISISANGTPNLGISIHNAVSFNNGTDGFIFSDDSTGIHMSNLVSVGNLANGILFDDVNAVATNVNLDGPLLIGGNATDCAYNNAGNISGVSGASCTGSSATVSTVTSLVSDLVGKTSDTLNTHSSGIEAYDSITDFLTMESLYKGWGQSHADAFPTTNHQGQCINSENCQIFDSSLSSSSSNLLNKSFDGAAVNGSFTSGATCPSDVDGDKSLTSSSGQIFLISAYEVGNDSIGDDDGLCEASEACIYAPNFGAYQGHSTLGSCSFNANGGISGVTMYGYAANGI